MDQIAAIVAEISTSLVFLFSSLFLVSASKEILEVLEEMAVYTVLGAIGINALLSVIRTILTLGVIFKEYREMIRKAEGVIVMKSTCGKQSILTAVN